VGDLGTRVLLKGKAKAGRRSGKKNRRVLRNEKGGAGAVTKRRGSWDYESGKRVKDR